MRCTSALRRRYASERWFRGVGFAAVSISVLFLAFLLYTMAAKGLGGFWHYEAAAADRFRRTDLFLDPATLRGPDAAQTVAGADLEGAISEVPRPRLMAPPRRSMFGDAAVDKLSDAIVANPDMLNGRATLWLPVASKIDIAAKDHGDDAAEQLVGALTQRHALGGRSTPGS